MDIAWFRDLVIILQGVVTIALLVMLGILAWAVYRRVKAIGDSAKQITTSVQEVVDSAKAAADDIAAVSSFARTEMAEPLFHVAGLVQGISRGLETMLAFFKKGKGGERCE